MKDIKKPACDIAVVGLEAIFPGALNGDGFWQNILEGNDLLSEIPSSHWLVQDYYHEGPTQELKTWAKKGGFLDDIPFDPLDFGLPPKLLSATDSVQLLSLIVAKTVLNQVLSLQHGKVSRDNTSIILGVVAATELVGQMSSKLQKPVWIKALREAGLEEDLVQSVAKNIENHYPEWTESTFPGLLGNVVAGRIANRLDLGGTNCVVDAACASSLAAITMAIQELELGHSDLVVTGGADAFNDILMYMCFTKTPALSKHGDCRPFSQDADGTMLGEGVGMLALRRLADAERDGDQIFAVIKGYGTSSDGKSKSVYAPVPEGQSKALKRAYAMAGYSPQDVGLIEAHGTATNAGDAAEFKGLSMAFSTAENERKQWCALGSVKSQIGHTKAAAGTASLFKVIMALNHKTLPPTIKVSKPNPELKIEDSPFYLNTEKRPWIQEKKKPRRAGISSFGFGGSNFHLTLEEYQKSATIRRVHYSPDELFLFSGNKIEEVSKRLLEMPLKISQNIDFYAKKSQLAFNGEDTYRFGFLANAKTYEKYLAKIFAHVNEGAEIGPSDHIFTGHGKLEGDLAFVYPGQGSQYVGMGRDLACEFSQVIDVWDWACTKLKGKDPKVNRFVFPKPVFSPEDKAQQELELKDTSVAQPAIGLASMGLLHLLKDLGVEARHHGGHSYGELTALYGAGSLQKDQFLRLSLERGRLMKEAAQSPGAMTAVKADANTIEQFLKEWSTDVVIANINSPHQVVIAGSTDGIASVESRLKSQGFSFTRLPVATAFHSAIVSEAVKPFEELVAKAKIKVPKQSVYANTLGEEYPHDLKAMKKLLSHQLANPVNFLKQSQKMYEQGARIFVEVGPNQILSGLLKSSLPSDSHIITLDRRGRHGLSSLWKALGYLACLGVPINFERMWENYMVRSPQSYSKATVPVRGTNVGRIYPPADLSEIPSPNFGKKGKTTNIISIEEKTQKQPTSAQEPKKPGASLANGWGAALKQISSLGSSERDVQSSKATNPINSTLIKKSSTNTKSTTGRGGGKLEEKNAMMSLFEDMQNKITSAHEAFQETMKTAHVEYISNLTGSFQSLVQSFSMPAMAGAGAGTLTASPREERVKSLVSAPKPPEKTIEVPPPSTPKISVSAPKKVEEVESPAPSMSNEIFIKDLLAVVSEKTGYPEDMLSLDMELESGLGIDSIKRVEILSALQDRHPDLFDQDPAAMSALSSLQDIIDFASMHTSKSISAQTPETVAPENDSSSSPSNEVFVKDLLEIVADKTGYPEEMLDMSMELESGLGIDSIKRVEILSSLQEKHPELADLDSSAMSQLNTLTEIVQFSSGQALKKKAQPSVLH